MVFKIQRPPEGSRDARSTEGDDARFQQSLAQLTARLAERKAREAAAAPKPAPAPPPAKDGAAEPPSSPQADVLKEVVREATRAVPPAPLPPVPNPPRQAPKPPPRLGPARIVDEPAKTAMRRRSHVALAIIWMLGIGAGAMAAGAFVGFLVNGPPQGWRSGTVTQAKPSPIPPPSPITDIVAPKAAAAAPPQTPATPLPVATAQAAPPPTEAPTQAARATPPAEPPAPAAAAAQPPASPPNPAQLASGEVMEMQSRLRAIGFNPGPVDGSAGPMTVQAVKQYQQARHLAPTGTVDRELLGRLRQERSNSPPGWTQQAHAPPPPPPPRRDNFMETIDRLLKR